MKCSINIIPATSHDIDHLVKLEEANFDTDKISRKQFYYLINQSKALVLTVKINEQLAASAIVLFRKYSTKARLYSIAVNAIYRKQGIAQALYDHIENNLLNKQYTEIYLEVKKSNHAAIQFYFKNKYKIHSELKAFYEDGEDAFRMRKIFC